MNFPFPIISVLFVLWAAQVVEADEGHALFNGKNLTGWQGMQGAPDNWGVKDGLLTCIGGKGAQWLATSEEFSDFDLNLEFNLPVNGNSGVFIRAPREGAPWVQGMEIQLLDDYGKKVEEPETGSVHGSDLCRGCPFPAGNKESRRVADIADPVCGSQLFGMGKWRAGHRGGSRQDGGKIRS